MWNSNQTTLANNLFICGITCVSLKHFKPFDLPFYDLVFIMIVIEILSNSVSVLCTEMCNFCCLCVVYLFIVCVYFFEGRWGS